MHPRRRHSEDAKSNARRLWVWQQARLHRRHFCLHLGGKRGEGMGLGLGDDMDKPWQSIEQPMEKTLGLWVREEPVGSPKRSAPVNSLRGDHVSNKKQVTKNLVAGEAGRGWQLKLGRGQGFLIHSVETFHTRLVLGRGGCLVVEVGKQ